MREDNEKQWPTSLEEMASDNEKSLLFLNGQDNLREPAGYPSSEEFKARLSLQEYSEQERMMDSNDIDKFLESGMVTSGEQERESEHETVEIALGKMREKFEEIPVRAELQAYIESGMARGKKSRRRSTVILRILAAACLVVAALLPVRVSPAYAAMVSKIPGLEYIVRLINYDQGLVAAVENNYVQHVNLADEHEGLVFSVKDIIVDEAQMIVFYSLKNEGNHRFVDLGKISVCDEQGKDLPVSVGWSIFGETDLQKDKEQQGKFEVNFNMDLVLPDQVLLKVRLRENEDRAGNFESLAPSEASGPATGDAKGANPAAGSGSGIPDRPDRDSGTLNSTWQVLIPLDKEKFQDAKQTYTLNKTIDIEGQKIKFKKVTVFPTRIAVDIQYDPSNTKKILGFDDLCIADEKGRKVSGIKNGISGTFPGPLEQTLYFESNYFTKPEELYLEGSSIRALAKTKLSVQVDLQKGILLNPPDDRLVLQSVAQEKGGYELHFQLRNVPEQDAGHAFNLFSGTITDAAGKEVQSPGSTVDILGSEGTQETLIRLKTDGAVASPLTFTIEDYPSRITGDFRIKIKG